MKKLVLLTALVLLISGGTSSQPDTQIHNGAFKRGEKLEYRVYYQAMLTGKVTAGNATMEVLNETKILNDHPTYHIVGEGRSKGAFSWFFKVVDRFETYIDEAALIPYYFVRRTKEGGYVKDDEVTFNHKYKFALSRTANKDIPTNVQDVMSAVYYARNIDFSNAKVGQNYPIPFFLDDSVYVSVIQYGGKEVIETELGRFRCLKFKPMVATGKVFSNPYPMTLWVTDDKNRLPLLVESAVIVGMVKAELISYSGLANPMTSKVD